MSVFVSALNAIFSSDDVAVDATYTPNVGAPSSLRVIIDNDVELIALGESEVADRRHIIGIRKTDIASPARGDVVTVGTTTYTVDRLFDDDGLEVRVIAKLGGGGALLTEGGLPLETESGEIIQT